MKRLLSLLFTLVLGAGLGFGFSRWRLHHLRSLPPEAHDRIFLDRFRADLDLTPEQEQKVGAILVTQREKIKALYGEILPRYAAIRDGVKSDIRALLSDRQRDEFDRIEHRAEEARRRLGGGPAGPPPFPPVDPPPMAR